MVNLRVAFHLKGPADRIPPLSGQLEDGQIPATNPLSSMGTCTWIEYYKCTRRTYRTGLEYKLSFGAIDGLLSAFEHITHTTAYLRMHVRVLSVHVGLKDAQLLSNRPRALHAEPLLCPSKRKSQIKSFRVRSKKREQNAPAEWATWRIGTQRNPPQYVCVPMLPKYPQIRGQQTALPEDSTGKDE